MRTQTPAFLTIAMEVASYQSDPLDSPAENKRLMVETADGLVDGAIAKMPDYLKSLPTGIRPTAEDLRPAFRRAYRLNGPRMEMDLCVIPGALPSAWIESMLGAPVDAESIPWPIVWTTIILGFWFGLGRADRQQVMKDAHVKTASQKRETIKSAICDGIMRLTSAAVETELRNNHTNLMLGSPLRSITIHRAL